MNMTKTETKKSRPMKVTGKGAAQRMDGVATLLHFSECQGVIMAANMRDLRKLARGMYLADFDPKKARRVSLRARKK